jgi:hypothetical protein
MTTPEKTFISKDLDLVGAYGRPANYMDWVEGLDFQIIGGPYCSIRDIEYIKENGIKYIKFYLFKPGKIELIKTIAIE